jgi:hypothetical protein
LSGRNARPGMVQIPVCPCHHVFEAVDSLKRLLQLRLGLPGFGLVSRRAGLASALPINFPT